MNTIDAHAERVDKRIPRSRTARHQVVGVVGAAPRPPESPGVAAAPAPGSRRGGVALSPPPRPVVRSWRHRHRLLSSCALRPRPGRERLGTPSRVPPRQPGGSPCAGAQFVPSSLEPRGAATRVGEGFQGSLRTALSRKQPPGLPWPRWRARRRTRGPCPSPSPATWAGVSVL